MNRKNFLKTFALAAASGSVLLAACGGDNGTKENKNTTPEETKTPEPAPATEAPTADCNDLSGVDAADIKQRESLAYVAKSTDPEKNCGNCRFYQEGNQPNGCGGCQLFKGPVNLEGNCNSWFKKDA